MDNAAAVQRVCLSYASSVMFDTLNLTKPDRSHRVHASWAFVDYFFSIFSGKPPLTTSEGVHNWVGALWEIRQMCGQEFTAKALLFTLKSFDDASDKVPKEKCDEYFFHRFVSGTSVVDNEFSNLPKVRDVLKARGLLPKPRG